MRDVKKKSTPIFPGMHLEKGVHVGQEEAVNLDSDNTQIYKEMNESAFYLATAIRPDLAFVCSRLEQISLEHSPIKKHWNTMFHVYSYIADSFDLSIVYNVRCGFNLECYTNSD